MSTGGPHAGIGDRPAPRRWDVVDHALARRAVLGELFAGRATALDVCDASPFLQRAAREWGRRTDTACPVCRRDRLLCPQCGWNHLVPSYRTGTPGTAPRRRTCERARD